MVIANLSPVTLTYICISANSFGGRQDFGTIYMLRMMIFASVVTSKPAMRGHFKTGHVTWPGT
jgi:hypothetical protein